MNSKLLSEEIKKINNLIIRKLVLISKKELNISLSAVQIMILKYLYLNIDDNINQRDIEEFVQIRKSTLSGILDTMEKSNLIVRINSRDDKRVKIIKLTDNGIQINKKLSIIANEFEKDISHNISSEELNNFYNVIEKINNNLKGVNYD